MGRVSVTYSEMQRTAAGVSMAMTIAGSIILIGCVGYLSIGWFADGRWGWGLVGIAMIVVNLAMVFLQFRKRKLAPAPTPRNPPPGRGDDDEDD
ncbi:hypothetical protein [Gordonia sp. (in: high G+C Gram-positive bacteria)]|jgi:Na+/melibiose symporter-like transporter|uniref:hypothetical protein n=1 Tax=Gordonia sp. (in: high G+C Gram-positive bacteria) TaxID=84139 RepID=UPI0025B8F067|nr:hypothetical protein [Gordonia sp. (in: high G+C Gram-positive bacteria)]HMS74852.1 hypothetical protein [Gordonia sp. (in: high G+C Gram-positive bacteria)]HQV19327.1 hypothetical protein [Gordonia sp. (in: high G+C Gram-positive bacteria)]